MTEDPPAIGFISPPGWIGPSPAEFPSACARPVRTQQVPLRTPGSDWRIDNVAAVQTDVAVTGAGARTLSLIDALEAESGLPVPGAATALDRAAARSAGVALRPGALGRIGDV